MRTHASTGLMPPHRTNLENRIFEIEYINLIQDSFSLMLLCRNVTLRSHILCRNVTLRSNYLIILFHQAFFIQGIILIERVQD